jgi:hypothetical protein
MTTTTYSLSRPAGDMQSPRGAIAAIVLLLALPVTILAQIVVGFDAEVVIHFALATGALLIASSVFDFAAPGWLTRTACVAAGVLGAIFFVQGLGALVSNDALRAFAYSPALGGWGETLTMSLVMLWFIAVARTHTHGVTMILGFASALLVIGLGIWSIAFAPVAGTPQELRLLFLLPIAWFLFASTRTSDAGRVVGRLTGR